MLSALSKLTTFKTAKLKAVLKGVAGFTGGGAVRYTEWHGGRRQLEISLTGIAGLKAEVMVNEALAARLACCNGEAAACLDTEKGEEIRALTPGVSIEIRQNGVVVLRGALAPD